jgi:hypothetical protein
LSVWLIFKPPNRTLSHGMRREFFSLASAITFNALLRAV